MRNLPVAALGDSDLLPSAPEGSSEGEHEPEVDVSIFSASAATSAAKPVYIIGRTARVESAEAEPRSALVVNIGGNRPTLDAAQVLREVAHHLEVHVESMQIMPFKPEDFLLLLPD